MNATSDNPNPIRTPRADRFTECPETAKKGSARDTKRWCRGVRGRKHEATWQYWFGGDPGPELPHDPLAPIVIRQYRQYHFLKCVVCGRHLDTCVVDSRKPPTPQLIAKGKLRAAVA